MRLKQLYYQEMDQIHGASAHDTLGKEHNTDNNNGQGNRCRVHQATCIDALI